MCECNHTSEYLPVISGVPQGSLLGPLVYLLYINDMFDLFTVAKPFTFADDTKLLITWYTPEDSNLFQLDLQELATWNNRWHLLLNISKCCHLHFHFSNTTHSTVTYHINGDALSTNHDNIKDLGIMFSTDLHWDVHYSKIVSKAYKIFYLLRRTFTTSSLIARKRLYLMMVRSQLTYCSPLWRPHLIKHITQLEKIQRRATKFILNDYSSDYKSRLFRTHILAAIDAIL